MSSCKVFDVICGFPESLLLSQTPMVCQLLLKSSVSLSCANPSVKKWMHGLTKMLKNSIRSPCPNKSPNDGDADVDNADKVDDDDEIFISLDAPSKEKANKADATLDADIDLSRAWSSLCLLSASYRVVSAGGVEWSKHCSLLLDLLENASIFYHPVLRTRCLETLCEILEYARCIHDASTYQLSLQTSARLIKFLQTIIVEIVVHQNTAFNCGGRLLQTALMTLYRLLANGKNLNAKHNAGVMVKACLHCLASGDYKIRSIAVGILVLLHHNDKKYNALMDKIIHTLHFLLRDSFPASMIVSYHGDDTRHHHHGIDREQCVSDILQLIPDKTESDTFERICVIQNVTNGLLCLLVHLIRRKHHKSLETLNASSSSTAAQSDGRRGGSTSGGSGNHHQRKDSVKIISASCSMNSFHLQLPLKNLLTFINDVACISINDCVRFGNLTECTAFLCELYQNALWLLVTVSATAQKSLLPYSKVIGHILISMLNETKNLKTQFDYDVRSSLYQSLLHIIPVFGPFIYDVLYQDVRPHLMQDLKSAQKLLMTSPPNPASLSQASKQQLVTSVHKKNGENPRKKQKIAHVHNSQDIHDKQRAICVQREYDTKLSFYRIVLQCVSTFCAHCSNYMSLDEKSEVELILSASLLSCYSEAGHILVNVAVVDLLHEFVAATVCVLMAPKIYKKPFLTLTAKLLSSAYGIGISLCNQKMIDTAQKGLSFIESVINPRSVPVYKKPLKMIASHSAMQKQMDGERGNLRQIDEWNRKMMTEILRDVHVSVVDQSSDEKDGCDELEMKSSNGTDNCDQHEDHEMSKDAAPAVKTSIAQSLLNKKRTFSELDADNVAINDTAHVCNDEDEDEEVDDASSEESNEEEDTVNINGFTADSFLVDDNGGSDNDDDEEHVSGNFNDQTIETIMKDYAQHADAEHPNDEHIKPLW
eukprot:CAMPEP_0202691020 /NCGR_PEP_ID=MMETSP1385-20130828/5853_1 /ASSEMBLY_ACC=CAM_ASM_000861 /TAXON_ID=933848 /ORGANISM="Elphidium margaritaceum" /LENGTH=934 /DNA_ID=CAMNT_0049346361 /DNA_START=23 /DNA_END=2824 /DNA_ORIENTATION=-